jgi:hypothetical protein
MDDILVEGRERLARSYWVLLTASWLPGSGFRVAPAVTQGPPAGPSLNHR